MFISLTGFQALLWAIFTPVVFIGSITVFNSSKLNRDHPQEIMRRIKVIGLVTVFWPLLLYFLFSNSELSDKGPSIFEWIGISFSIKSYVSVLSGSAITLVLFAGPLFQMLFDEEESQTEYDMKAIRAYVAAPIYEEAVFRSALITALIAGGSSFSGSVILSSFVFGISHLYHLVEAFQSVGRIRQQKISQAIMQTVYTTLFGLYVGYIFVVTGSLYAVILIHAFCNFMGLPDLGFLSAEHKANQHKKSILIAYTVGIGLFSYLLTLIMNPDLHKSWHYTLIQRLASGD